MLPLSVNSVNSVAFLLRRSEVARAESKLEQIKLGQPSAEWPGTSQTESLSGNGESRLAQPRRIAVCVAHPDAGRVRWLRAGHHRHSRFHDGRRASVYGAARSIATQYQSGARCKEA